MSNAGMSEFHLHDMSGSVATQESAHVRMTISKFGGMIKEGPVVAIPPQTWNKADRTYLALHPNTDPCEYEMRHQPTHVVVGAGIPGYTGHRAHNPTWNNPHRRPDLRSPTILPHLEAEGKSHLADEENYVRPPLSIPRPPCLTARRLRSARSPRGWRDRVSPPHRRRKSRTL